MARRPSSTALRRRADSAPPKKRGTDDRRRPGRPPVHDEAWTKVTVVLFDRQIAYLDRLADSINARSGATISRAQLIRALVDAIGDAEVDLTASTCEIDLKNAIAARLATPKSGS
jgi:hypothetical protein